MIPPVSAAISSPVAAGAHQRLTWSATGKRNVVERWVNRLKHFRAVATRYDTQSMMRPVRVGSSV
jgi:transposase